jgi:hypothetical protein
MAAELRKGPPDGGRPADPVEALRKDAAEQLPRFIEAYRARLKGEPLPLSPQ